MLGRNLTPGLWNNVTLTAPGREILFRYDQPGQKTGYNNSYVTSTSAGEPKYMAFVSQLNVTYVPLNEINTTSGYGSVYQPDGNVFVGDPQINGTMFVALVDDNPYITPYNFSLINNHTISVGLYQSG